MKDQRVGGPRGGRGVLLPSTAALLEPRFLSRLTGLPVHATRRVPLEAGFAHSGSTLDYVELESKTRERVGRLVLKRVSAQHDWLMRATEDARCRSVTVWSIGLLDRLQVRLPDLCAPPVAACARDGEDGFAILMPDYGAGICTNRPFDTATTGLLLKVMAAMHATFLDDPVLGRAELGLCSLESVYGMFSPRSARAELAREGYAHGQIPARILEGWEAARGLVPADVMTVVEPLLEDPAPLCSALRRFPSTLVHGDFRHSNLARTEDGRVALLDWQLAAHGPPSVELGRFIGANSALFAQPKERILAQYRAEFERAIGFSVAQWWEPQLALGLLGGFVQDGWAIVLKATTWDIGAPARAHWRADLDWWIQQVRAAAALLT